MKRLILAGLGLLLAHWVAEAQVLKFGARVGLNTGVYDFEQVYTEAGTVVPVADRCGGYQLGAMMRLSIPHFLYIQPELDVLTRDLAFGVKQEGEPMQYKNIRVVRLELPVMVGFNIAAAHFFAGPVWHISTRQHSRGSSSTPLELRFDDNDVAAMAGAAIDFDGIFMEVRYMRYLRQTDVEMRVSTQRTMVDVAHDDMLQISFGVLF